MRRRASKFRLSRRGKGQHLQFLKPAAKFNRWAWQRFRKRSRHRRRMRRHRQKVALAENNREGRRGVREEEIHFSSQPCFEEPSLLRSVKLSTKMHLRFNSEIQVSDATDGAIREKGKGRGTDEQIFRPGR